MAKSIYQVTCSECGRVETVIYDPVKRKWPLPGWLYRSPYQHICPECIEKKGVYHGQNSYNDNS